MPQRLNVPARSFVVQMLVRLGDMEAARSALAEMDDDERDCGERRAALASLRLAENDAEAAVDALAPVLDGSVPSTKTSVIQAGLVDALAREALGEPQAAEASIERALGLAEPDGIVFPFVATPVSELLERHPRHSTSHAALLSDILNVLAGSSLSAPAGQTAGAARAALVAIIAGLAVPSVASAGVRSNT